VWLPPGVHQSTSGPHARLLVGVVKYGKFPIVTVQLRE
jgi:hypothetical protein